MRALIKLKPEPGIWLEEVAMPAVGPKEVLIKIKKTAICGTDLHIYRWDDWAKKNIKTPLIVGHEFVGEIADIGSEVKHTFNIGDRVSGEGHISCGHCRNCRSARSHLCRQNVSVGVTRNGCFADYLVIPATQAYAIPDNIPDSTAAILDPMGNATHTTLSFDLVGEDVLITGAGAIGCMATAIAKKRARVSSFVTDINDYHLTLATKMGATRAINPTKTTLKSVMSDLNMREGFDVGLEMSGSSDAFNDMIKHMNHAGKIALLGFLPESTRIDWTQFIMKGLLMKGIYGREVFETWYKMIAMLQSGLDVSPILTHEVPVQDYQKAFEILSTGQSGKIVMCWD